MIDSHVSQLQEYIISYNYLLLFAVLVAETSPIGLVIPGTVVIVLSGYYAGLGELNLLYVILVGVCGVFLGDILSFVLGKFGLVKSDFVQKHLGRLSVITDKLNKKKNLIMVSHFPGYTRMFVPVLLGSSGFKFKSWIWRDGIGAFLLVLCYSLIGFGIGTLTRSLNAAVTIAKVLPLAFAGLFIVYVIFAIFQLRKAK